MFSVESLACLAGVENRLGVWEVIGRSVVYVIDCSGSAGKHLPYALYAPDICAASYAEGIVIFSVLERIENVFGVSPRVKHRTHL